MHSVVPARAKVVVIDTDGERQTCRWREKGGEGQVYTDGLIDRHKQTDVYVVEGSCIEYIEKVRLV